MKSITNGQLRLKINDGQFENQYVMYAGSKNEDIKPMAIVTAMKWEMGSRATGNNKTVLTISSAKVIHTADEVSSKLGTPSPWKIGDPVPAGLLKKAIPSGKENTKPSGSSGRYVAIQTLTPYMNKWTIKGRVTQKDKTMRTWKNAKGEGCLFGFVIADETCDMKVTSFKEEAEKFFPMIEKGKVYQISNGQLKNKNKNYNTTQQDYELTLSKISTIEEVFGDSDDVPTQIYDFKALNELENIVIVKDATGRAERKVIDICAVVKEAGEVNTIHIKSQDKDLAKRELTLVDDSSRSVKCTLWGDEANNFDQMNVGSVVALKGASLSDFGGRSISVGQATDIAWGLRDDKRAEQLQDWWASTGGEGTFTPYGQGGSAGGSGGGSNEWKFLNQVNPVAISQAGDGKPMYFTTKATVTFISKENPVYKGCSKTVQDRKCQKKLIDEGNGNYRCEKCDTSDAEFEYRLIMKAAIADDLGTHFVTFFQEQGSQLLHMDSQEFGRLFDDREQQDREFDRVMSAPLFKELVLNNRATLDNWQDEQRCRVSVSKLAEMNYAQHTERLLEEIKKFSV